MERATARTSEIQWNDNSWTYQVFNFRSLSLFTFMRILVWIIMPVPRNCISPLNFCRLTGHCRSSKKSLNFRRDISQPRASWKRRHCMRNIRIRMTSGLMRQNAWDSFNKWYRSRWFGCDGVPDISRFMAGLSKQPSLISAYSIGLINFISWAFLSRNAVLC
jgi:hypothetical protein